jgi:hypothetical protein
MPGSVGKRTPTVGSDLPLVDMRPPIRPNVGAHIAAARADHATHSERTGASSGSQSATTVSQRSYGGVNKSWHHVPDSVGFSTILDFSPTPGEFPPAPLRPEASACHGGKESPLSVALCDGIAPEPQ